MADETLHNYQQPEILGIELQHRYKFRSEYQLPDPKWSLPEKEFTNILANIDFHLLKKIFKDIHTGDINFLEITDIYQFDNPFSEACFIPEGNLICLNGNTIKETTKLLKQKYKNELPNEQLLLKLRLLEVLIHEEVHATSYIKMENWNDSVCKHDCFRKKKATCGAYMKKQSGYHFIEYTKNSLDELNSSSKLRDFDEGVTEKLSQEILQIYLNNDNSDSSIEPEEIEKYFTFKKTHGKEINPYCNVIKLVDENINEIAKHLALTKEIVWQKIVFYKKTGFDLNNYEFKDFLK